MPDLNKIIEDLSSLTVAEAADLSKQLEEKWGVQLPIEHPVWPWLVEYAAFLLTRGEVGEDGKTA